MVAVLAPEVIDLGYRNQPCFVNGNWQAHVWFEDEWWVEPRCDCPPSSGIELRCMNCGRVATSKEEDIFYRTVKRDHWSVPLREDRPDLFQEREDLDYLDLPF